MLRPYWRSIGFTIVKDVLSKPQKAILVSDLIEHTRNQLLITLRGYVLPILVLTKRKDILQCIADAKRTTIGDICSQPRRNLAGILAMLLCQDGVDVERWAMDTLSAVAPGFRQPGQELHHLVKQEPVFIACEVLELAAEQGGKDKKLVGTIPKMRNLANSTSFMRASIDLLRCQRRATDSERNQRKERH